MINMTVCIWVFFCFIFKLTDYSGKEFQQNNEHCLLSMLGGKKVALCMNINQSDL